MPYYQDQGGALHFLEADEFAYLLPDGCTRITDEQAAAKLKPTDEQVISDKWEAIKAERDRRTHEGGFQIDGKWFHSDEFSRAQQLGLVMLGQNIPAGLQWKTMDGSFVTMTPQLAQQILQATAASDVAIFSAAEAHRIAMAAAADPSSYDFSSDWPKVFERMGALLLGGAKPG